MPILEIEIVSPDSTSSMPANLSQSLADGIAAALEAPPGRVWVKLRLIPSTAYAENGGVPEGVHPVFVNVLASRVPEGRELEGEIAKLTTVIAKILGRPFENIHVVYRPHGAGRVAFGGKLIQ